MDLKKMKHESFKEENFDQIENFNEYEAFLGNSYNNRLLNTLNRMFDNLKTGANSVENTKEFFLNQAESLMQDYTSFDQTKLTRTQDIKLMQPLFSVPAQPANDMPLVGQSEHTLLDKINSEIVDGDEHYKKFKFGRQSNFKHGLINSLGVYENQTILQKQLG